MNARFRAQALGAVLCLGFCARNSAAQPSGDVRPSGSAPTTAKVAPSRRTLVIFAVNGHLAPEVQEPLRRLLGAELRATGLGLRERAATEPLSAWVRRVEREESPLLSAVLEVQPDRLRLIVIDSARGRAIARELPGGVAENAANVEAVVSIVLSASRALLEGLEVASTPVEAMLGEAPPPAAKARETSHTPLFPAASGLSAPESVAKRGIEVHASVAGTLTTFSEVEDIMPGVAAALALTLPSGLELRLSATRERTASVVTPFGSFALGRSAASFGAGLIFRTGAFSLLPEAAFAAEWLSRSDTIPAAGASASAPRTSTRFGVELGGRARFTFLRPLSAEVGAGAAYFGRSVRFTAADPDETELVRLVPLTFGARLGLDVVFD